VSLEEQANLLKELCGIIFHAIKHQNTQHFSTTKQSSVKLRNPPKIKHLPPVGCYLSSHLYFWRLEAATTYGGIMGVS
jgi:hypothetical protein